MVNRFLDWIFEDINRVGWFSIFFVYGILQLMLVIYVIMDDTVKFTPWLFCPAYLVLTAYVIYKIPNYIRRQREDLKLKIDNDRGRIE